MWLILSFNGPGKSNEVKSKLDKGATNLQTSFTTLEGKLSHKEEKCASRVPASPEFLIASPFISYLVCAWYSFRSKKLHRYFLKY